MRARHWSVGCALVLIGAVASSGARAEVSWGGPGWYVESTATGFDTELVSGPYAEQSDCDAALPADTDDYSYACSYEINDPSDDDPP